MLKFSATRVREKRITGKAQGYNRIETSADRNFTSKKNEEKYIRAKKCTIQNSFDLLLIWFSSSLYYSCSWLPPFSVFIRRQESMYFLVIVETAKKQKYFKSDHEKKTQKRRLFYLFPWITFSEGSCNCLIVRRHFYDYCPSQVLILFCPPSVENVL